MHISIFSGHHYTRALILGDSDATPVKGRALNTHNIGWGAAGTRLREMLTPFGLSHGDWDSVTLILPGVTTPRDYEDGLSILSAAGVHSSKSVMVVDDTIAALLANHNSLHGVCVFAGTGASVFCGHKLRDIPTPVSYPFKFDGWGALLGDCGGGFTIGMNLLREICRSIDRECDCPEIFHLLGGNAHGLDDPSRLQNWFDELLRDRPEEWRLTIADLAAIVTKRISEVPDDQFCTKLIDYEVEELWNTLKFALDNNRIDASVVICQGGMFQHCARFFQGMKSYGDASGKRLIFRLAEWNPVVGGLIIGSQQASGIPFGRQDVSLVDDLRSRILQRLSPKREELVYKYDFKWKQDDDGDTVVVAD